jgi:thiosulfate dehydrogenase
MIKLVTLIIYIFCMYACDVKTKRAAKTTAKVTFVEQPWIAPDTNTIPNDAFGKQVKYGRALVLNTAYYIGPNGVVSKNLGNKMNCSNCHLNAGTQPYGLNYFSAHARYPQYRGRENKILTLADRINNCIERPHNGTPLPLGSNELVAIECYIKWLGQNVPVNTRVVGDEGIELKHPNSAANVANGEALYGVHCASCHATNGAGKMKLNNVCYEYPPLWGKYAYQPGSSMHRVLKAARFIKANMPYGTTWRKPKLTDTEAIDVAAFINSNHHARPSNKRLINYPNINVKPIDYDTKPYNDTFSEVQHKYGPYEPIIEYHKKNNLPVIF